jgi:hypothetical protein
MQVGCRVRRMLAGDARRTLAAILSFACWTTAISARAQSPAPATKDNGIHVGIPKVYDSRELTLMLDNLSQQLQNKNFVDPKALAAALGNIQGYQNSDFSLGVFGNGAVGPQAASVFAAAGGGGSTTPPGSTSTSTTPTVTINVAPTLNAGTGAASTTPPAATTTPLGPQAPALPSLQTAPSYTPTFGSNGSDLLSDEVNLTYQLYNVRMLLDRSLTDRLHGSEPRLEAVVGFDVDLEPDHSAKDAAAIMEITVEMATGDAGLECSDGGPSLVALMPEEGSHNAATLSQKADAFGGAIASSVFSVGFAAQKRNQGFYLYRDMDTVSFQGSKPGDKSLKFGSQFRPVLGRHSVDPGMRHMIVVLGLPCSDKSGVSGVAKVNMHLSTRWQRYDGQTQTTKQAHHFWNHRLPDELPNTDFPTVEIPSTDSSQRSLRPSLTSVKWIPTDATNGVAVVTGKNLFPGTTVRLGNKTYASAADGLTMKSDQELEVVAPLSSVAVGGVLSGRYGAAVSLEAPATTTPSAGFNIAGLRLYPLGNDMYQVIADLSFKDSNNKDIEVTVTDLESKLNPPVAVVNGAPLPVRPALSEVTIPATPAKTVGSGTTAVTLPATPSRIAVSATTMVPADVVTKMASFTIVFPFAGTNWSASMPYYQTTLKVTRLGGSNNARLLISATNPAIRLCEGWALELEKDIPKNTKLACVDPERKTTVSFDYPAKCLKPYHHFMLTKGEEFLIGDIPAPEPPPPGPSLDKDQKVSIAQNDVGPVKFTGKHLDEVTKVLFDKLTLQILKQEDKDIVIYLSRQVTSKAPNNVALLLLSDGNDPVIATVSVTPPKAGTPPKKGD